MTFLKKEFVLISPAKSKQLVLNNWYRTVIIPMFVVMSVKIITLLSLEELRSCLTMLLAIPSASSIQQISKKRFQGVNLYGFFGDGRIIEAGKGSVSVNGSSASVVVYTVMINGMTCFYVNHCAVAPFNHVMLKGYVL